MAHVHRISVSRGGVPKWAVPEAQVRTGGVEGDRQATPKIHGGPERALCLFSLERIEALRKEGHTISPGASGENLTLTGIAWEHLTPGDRLRVGETVRLEVTSYTAPCAHNAQWFADGDVRRIAQQHHPGWSRLYAKVLAEGRVAVGDRVVVEEQDHGKGTRGL